MRIAIIVGTRPEAIKMCPVIEALRKKEGVTVTVLLSGQHRELAREVLREFSIVPDGDLDLMRQGQTLFDITTGVLVNLPPCLLEEKPNAVLVHGDTTTAFAASLCAFYLGIPIGHVEAGLRTYCPRRPFPEEFNRRAIAAMASWHFAPTPLAKCNLVREGIAPERVYTVGNTVVDALRRTVRPDYEGELPGGKGRALLFTAHRREMGEGELRGLLRALRRITRHVPDAEVFYPVHPRLASLAREELEGAERIFLLPPLGTVACHNLMARATLIITDSGGMQEEACALGVPTLVLRTETERPEGVESGQLRLVGTDGDALFRVATELLTSPLLYATMRRGENPFGDGHAADRIADILCRDLSPSDTRVALSHNL